MKSPATMSGFTLLEMLLVMTIIAGIMLGIATYSQQRTLQLREDRSVLQMQQILNAGLAYYLNNTQWPDDIAKNLQGLTTSAGYLPGPSSAVTINNPWGTGYIIGNSTNKTLSASGIFAVCTTINAGTATPVIASILAARLPMAYVANGDVSANCAPGSGPLPQASACTLPAPPVPPAPPTEPACTVIATVNAPGQNLNNARSVNFAGIYHHGACVAAPKCPQNMTPQIFLAPVSVSGMDSNINELTPIHSFTAYYVSGGPVSGTSGGGACSAFDTVNPTPPCPGGGSNDKYWRVCLQVITTNGQVIYTYYTSAAQTILAFTRCAPVNESGEDTVVGSPLSVRAY